MLRLETNCLGHLQSYITPGVQPAKPAPPELQDGRAGQLGFFRRFLPHESSTAFDQGKEGITCRSDQRGHCADQQEDA